jgi:4-amino-4-deoxy-L-arabinose transferase-like glycosyltransferase
MGEMHVSQRRGTRVTAAASALVILICLFGNLGVIGLIGPDEPRYAWIARAMATTGDWVTPQLYGQPWFEKPVLYYWGAAIGFLLRLPPEWATRLPSAFAALAAAIAIGWLGWRHYGSTDGFDRGPALLAPLLFSTSVAAVAFARAATPDMLFSALLTLAMAAAASTVSRAGALRTAVDASSVSRHAALPLLLFGALLGAATLAKGPAAIILAGGAIGLWALATKEWRAALRMVHPIAIAAFCAVALPWYVLCALRNLDFLRIFIFQHNFERYLTPEFHHPQPFWFFGPVLLAAILPWTVLLGPVAREGLRLWREKSWSRSPGFFFACWVAFPVLFFSFSQSKLPAYVLPAIPPLALLCSIGALRGFQWSRATASLVGAGIGAAWILLALSGLLVIHRLPADVLEETGLLRQTQEIAVVAVVVGLLMAFLGFRRRLGLVIGICALCVTAGVEFASFQILPRLDPLYSARPHALLLRNDRHADRIFTYDLQRSWNYGLAFYFGRELPEWSSADPEPALVLTTPEGLTQIRSLGRFRGALDEAYVGILYVPIRPAPR